MYPLIHHELMNARVADFRRRAERDQTARAAAQASRARQERGENPRAGRPAGVLARHVLAFLGARSA
jgi:hypothetical protein